MRPLLASLPVLLLASLVTACSTPAADDPVTTQTVAPTATRLPRVVLPPRPRDIDLTGIDTCTLLTEPQRQELGLDAPWVPADFDSQLYQGPVRACTTRRDRAPAFDVGLIISDRVGIETWTLGEVSGTVTATSVSGFPAVQVIPHGQTSYCDVIVDVGPKELVDVQFSDGGSRATIPQPELCTRGKRTAELVITTVTTTFGR